jgi:methylated-DNA-[protein]-cysteine S-methyltransferase
VPLCLVAAPWTLPENRHAGRSEVARARRSRATTFVLDCFPMPLSHEFHVEFSTALGMCALSWNDEKNEALTHFRLPENTPDSGILYLECPSWIAHIIRRVRNHFEGRLDDFYGIPLDWPRVTPFQRGVYELTQAVKPGHTTTYGEIARHLGLGPEGARAVGVALGANPWPLIVPCHRVVAADGKMTGFSAPGGITTKTRLLALEGAELPLS